MNNISTNGSDKKKSKKGLIIAIILIIVINLLNSADSYVIAFVIYLLIILAFVSAIVAFIVHAIKKAKNQSLKNSGNPDGNEYGGRGNDRYADVTEKVYTPRRNDAPQKTYYESSEVYDDFRHDKEQRIAQLKVFLNNGIIDKDEYKVLLRKYESEN